jgi:hypothetical protein
VLHRGLFSSLHSVCFLMHVCGWFGGYGGWDMHAIPFDTAVSCCMIAVSCLYRLQWSRAIKRRSSQVPVVVVIQ